MDAISLLTRDHRTVSKLFRDHEKASASARAGLYERIRAELEVHAQIEEKIFYPALREAPGGGVKEQVAEALHEHTEVKSLLRSMTGLQAGNPGYEAKFRKLVEDVEHHVEEEQTQLFPQARTLLGRERLRTLGAEMMALKQTLSAGSTVPLAMQAVGVVGGVIRKAVRALRSRGKGRSAARSRAASSRRSASRSKPGASRSRSSASRSKPGASRPRSSASRSKSGASRSRGARASARSRSPRRSTASRARARARALSASARRRRAAATRRRTARGRTSRARARRTRR